MTDPATVLGALVDLVADAVVGRLRATGLAPTSPADAPSMWYTQDTCPIARRSYLKLCSSGKIDSWRHGKTVLVERKVLDAWIVANAAATVPPAAASPIPAAPTNEQLMRAAGFNRVAASRAADPGPESGRRRRAGKRAG